MKKNSFFLFLITNYFFASMELKSARLYEDIKTGTLTVKLGGKSGGNGSIKQNEIEKEAKKIIKKGNIKNIVFKFDEQKKDHLQIKSKIENLFNKYKKIFNKDYTPNEEEKDKNLLLLNFQERTSLFDENSEDSSITTTSSPSSGDSSSSDEVIGPIPTMVEKYKGRVFKHQQAFKKTTGDKSAKKHIERLNLGLEIINPQIAHAHAYENHGPNSDTREDNLTVISQKANLKMKIADGKYENGDIDGNFFVVKKDTKISTHSIQQLLNSNFPITPSIVIQSSLKECSESEKKEFKKKVERSLNRNRMKKIKETSHTLFSEEVTLEGSRKKVKNKINALEKKGKMGPFFIKFSDQSRINRSLDEDSNELLKDSLNELSKKENKKIIRKKLRTEVSREKRQIIFDLAFRIVHGYASNPSYILDEMVSIVGTLSKALQKISIDQFSNVEEIANGIFGSDYYDVDSDHFDLEERLILFHTFINSPHNHVMDQENRGDLLYVYHIICDNLRALKIEPEDIQEYLADFVENFKDLTDEDLKDICSKIDYIYDSSSYSDLKGEHNCEDWKSLAEELCGLNTTQRETLTNFLSWLPSNFDFGPADAIQILKDEKWLRKIEKLESFDDIEKLTEEAFQRYEEQDDQLKALDLIISGLIENLSHKKILKKIKKSKYNW